MTSRTSTTRERDVDLRERRTGRRKTGNKRHAQRPPESVCSPGEAASPALTHRHFLNRIQQLPAKIIDGRSKHADPRCELVVRHHRPAPRQTSAAVVISAPGCPAQPRQCRRPSAQPVERVNHAHTVPNKPTNGLVVIVARVIRRSSAVFLACCCLRRALQGDPRVARGHEPPVCRGTSPERL